MWTEGRRYHPSAALSSHRPPSHGCSASYRANVGASPGATYAPTEVGTWSESRRSASRPLPPFSRVRQHLGSGCRSNEGFGSGAPLPEPRSGLPERPLVIRERLAVLRLRLRPAQLFGRRDAAAVPGTSSTSKRKTPPSMGRRGHVSTRSAQPVRRFDQAALRPSETSAARAPGRPRPIALARAERCAA